MSQDVSKYYRYCPPQPKAKISDAVCTARQKSNYPYCKECQFNDTNMSAGETSPPSDQHTVYRERQSMVEKVFKAYDVRGTYPDQINEDIAWRIGQATAGFLRKSLSGVDRASARANAIAVGRDMRKSSPSLFDALVEGILSTGTTVIDVGMIDTSQIYFAINHLGTCGGIQTTASHNPGHYNGFKISGAKGVPVGAATGLNEIRDTVINLVRHDTGTRGQIETHELDKEYREFILSFLDTPRPLKIAVDGSNGMAGKWVPIIFGDVKGLDLTCINMETTGEFVHDPNPLIESNLRQLQDEIRRIGADFGICFDGDADRLVVLDENAEVIRCDILTAILAKQFLQQNPGGTIVYDLRSTKALVDVIRESGGNPKRERVGHAFMKKALADSKGPFGGELSGHFYFQDNFFCDSGMLALVHTINTLTRENKPMSGLAGPLMRYASSGERNYENPEQDKTIEELADIYKEGQIDYLDGITVQFDNWWFNVRKSNTEPLLRLNLEADMPDLMNEKLAELTPRLGKLVDH